MDIELLKKEIRFRARRGLKETDLIFTRFMDTHLNQLSTDELLELRDFLQLPDQQLLSWIVDDLAPAKARTALFTRIQASSRRGPQ